MPTFDSFDGVRLHYEQVGTGRPVVLLHSFPFDSRVWTSTGVVDALVTDGQMAITLDRRGHGRSARPREAASYANNAPARDVSRLLDHLRLDSADLLAYSLGSQIGLRLLQTEPRVRRAVLGGVGDRVLDWDQERADRLAAQLEVPDTSQAYGAQRQLLDRIEHLGADRFALAAEFRGPYVTYDPDFSAVHAQVLLLNGTHDQDFGSPARLAAHIPGARVELIEADHTSTLDHPDFVRRALAFLDA